MSPPLDGCWAKIERANENIENLEIEIVNLDLAKKYPIHREVNDQAREYVFYVAGRGNQTPLRIAVLTGEIIHHLRSSLDHLMWALVLARHPSPSFKVQFPICATEEKFISACKNGLMKGISSSSQEIIKRVQPYFKINARTPDPPSHPLTILHDFSIADKHTLLVVVSAAIIGPNSLSFTNAKIADAEFVKYTPDLWPRRPLNPTENNTELLRVQLLPGMPPNVDVNANFPVEIAFEKFGTSGVKPIIPGLQELRDTVVKTIKLFAGEL